MCYRFLTCHFQVSQSMLAQSRGHFQITQIAKQPVQDRSVSLLLYILHLLVSVGSSSFFFLLRHKYCLLICAASVCFDNLKIIVFHSLLSRLQVSFLWWSRCSFFHVSASYVGQLPKYYTLCQFFTTELLLRTCSFYSMNTVPWPVLYFFKF